MYDTVTEMKYGAENVDKQLEKQRKTEERAAKKAANQAKKAEKELEKQRKTEERAAKKAANKAKKTEKNVEKIIENAENNSLMLTEQINEINEMYSQEMKKETIQEEKVISSEKIHKHVEKHEECEEEEEEEEDPNCKVVRPAEIQERLEAMKKVVLTARANLAAFESAYNELSELLGSESQV